MNWDDDTGTDAARDGICGPVGRFMCGRKPNHNGDHMVLAHVFVNAAGEVIIDAATCAKIGRSEYARGLRDAALVAASQGPDVIDRRGRVVGLPNAVAAIRAMADAAEEAR